MLSGHFRFYKTFCKIREIFYWPGYINKVKEFVKQCYNCQINSKTKNSSTIIPIVSKKPFEIVEIDIIGPFNTTKNGNKYALCIVYLFTKYAQAIPLPNTNSQFVCNALLNNFIYIFGTTKRIHCDNGKNFQSSLTKKVLQKFNIQQSRTTPYHPQCNGGVERFNKTIKNIIKKCDNNKEWDENLLMFVYIYNTNTHSSTGFSPFHLIFGKPNALININKITYPSKHSYIQDLKKTLNKLKQITKKI